MFAPFLEMGPTKSVGLVEAIFVLLTIHILVKLKAKSFICFHEHFGLLNIAYHSHQYICFLTQFAAWRKLRALVHEWSRLVAVMALKFGQMIFPFLWYLAHLFYCLLFVYSYIIPCYLLIYFFCSRNYRKRRARKAKKKENKLLNWSNFGMFYFGALILELISN